MSRHIIALQIFAGFVQEFAQLDKELQIYLVQADPFDEFHTEQSILRTEELIAGISF